MSGRRGVFRFGPGNVRQDSQPGQVRRGKQRTPCKITPSAKASGAYLPGCPTLVSLVLVVVLFVLVIIEFGHGRILVVATDPDEELLKLTANRFEFGGVFFLGGR